MPLNYDALYVSLATVLETRLITADKKLEDALRKTPLKKHVVWLGEA
jgi:predicted nucleic acid-binding protein